MAILSTARGAGGDFGIISPVIVVLLVVCAGLLFVMYTRARVDRRNRERGTARERIELVKSRASVEDEWSDQMAEMVQLATRLADQLDTRAARLEQLIERAESARESLERSCVGAAAARPLTEGIASNHTPVPVALPTPASVIESDGLQESIEGDTDADAAAAQRGIESLAREIVGLAEEGLTSIQIAQRLEEATGKVELILALHRQAQRREAHALEA